MLETKFHNK